MSESKALKFELKLAGAELRWLSRQPVLPGTGCSGRRAHRKEAPVVLMMP